MIATFNANSPSPVVQQAHVAEQPNDYLLKPLSQPEPPEATPEIMRYPITVGRSVKRPSDITTRDIAYVMEALRTGYYEGYNLKKAIEVIRNMPDKEAQRNAKSTLPWFCGSLCELKRANANVRQASFMVFDLDHVGVTNSLSVESPLSVESLQLSLVSKLSPSFEAARTTHGSQLPQPFPFVVHSAAEIETDLNIAKAESTPNLTGSNSPTKAESTPNLTGSNSPAKAESTPNLQAQAIEDMKALAVAKLPYIRYAMRSVVDGVKLVAQFTKPITSEEVYRRVYIFLALQIEWALKHPCDATPDWARACFMSFDPNLIINHNCQPLDAQVCYKQAMSVMEIPFPKGEPISGLARGNREIATPIIDSPSDYAKAEAVINTMSQIPIAYKDWVKIGQALYAGFGERGKALWDMFLGNPNYKDSQVMMDAHWRSFRSTHSITLASLFYLAEKYGVKYE